MKMNIAAIGIALTMFVMPLSANAQSSGGAAAGAATGAVGGAIVGGPVGAVVGGVGGAIVGGMAGPQRPRFHEYVAGQRGPPIATATTSPWARSFLPKVLPITRCRKNMA